MSYNQLPKAFKAWQPWLSWFDESLQPVVADLMMQLNILLGPVKESHWNAQKLFSGLGDLRQRGNYEHLLFSEWLIAEDEPDEFIRRAVNYEHLFLAPLQEKSKANGVIIALFESSVLQLGVQRLVHLILMLLLEIRSYNHHSQFYWGVIENPSQLTLFKDINDLKFLLNHRSKILATNQMFNNWTNYFKQSNLIYDECWLIGGNHPSAEFITHQVSIDRLIKYYDKLSVEIKNRSTTRHCLLSLPNNIICAKMLSGQFISDNYFAEIEKRSIVPINIEFKPIISNDGNHILTFTHDKTNAYSITINDMLSSKQICRIQYYYLKGSVLGLDFQGKRIIAFICEQQKLYLWQSNKPKIELSMDFNLDQDKLLPQFICLYGNHGYDVFFIEENKSLLCCWYGISKKKDEVNNFHIIADNVITLFKLDERRAGYVYLNDMQQLCIHGLNHAHLNYCLVGFEKQVNQQIYVTAENLWLKGFGRLAIGYGRQWTVFTTENDFINVTTPNDWQIFGLFYDAQQNCTNFVMINQDKKQVALFDYLNNKIIPCLRSVNEIVSYSYNSLAKSFSITNQNGELMLYSLITQSIRLKLIKTD
ncbi:hypothetical protein [uncultured Gilliamella sp.]|uniref:hypothetical protein n=1 Tax=uncultured Gilliamella sp. TaxID=1193505 RepID=UPI0025D8AAF0|nr:hypothetical protein [uncultured Gilliamella sp.]